MKTAFLLVPFFALAATMPAAAQDTNPQANPATTQGAAPGTAPGAAQATTQESTTYGPTRESVREAVREATRETDPATSRTATQNEISETAPAAGAAAGAAGATGAAAAGAAAGKSDTKVLTGSYLREVDDNEPLLGPGNMTVRQMEDAHVVDARGERVGDVEEVIANNRGQIVGITAEVGGFLGIGDKEVLVPLEQLTVENGRFRTKLTVDQLKALPGWDDD